MPVIDHDSFAHYSVAGGNSEMKSAFPAVGTDVALIAGGGFDGASEARLGSATASYNNSVKSYLVRKLPASVIRAVLSFDVRFSSPGTPGNGGMSGFFCIQDAGAIGSEIGRVNTASGATAWTNGLVFSRAFDKKLSVSYIRGASTLTVIAVSSAPVYTGDSSVIYNHEILLDVSSSTAVLKVRVNGAEVISTTFNRDQPPAAYRLMQVGGCGWSSNTAQAAVTNLSSFVAYTEDEVLVYPAGPLNLTTIETGLSALDSHPANPGTYDVITGESKTYAMSDVGPSIPAGAPVLAAWLEARMSAANGGQAEPIVFEVLDSVGNIAVARSTSIVPGFPDQILITDVTDNIGDIAAVNGAQVRIVKKKPETTSAILSLAGVQVVSLRQPRGAAAVSLAGVQVVRKITYV